MVGAQGESNNSDRRTYTIADVFHAAATERHFNYLFWLEKTFHIFFQCLLKFCGKFLVLFATVIISYIVIFGFKNLLPYVAPERNLWFLFHAGFGKFSCCIIG
jgi:hypothetical protein